MQQNAVAMPLKIVYFVAVNFGYMNCKPLLYLFICGALGLFACKEETKKTDLSKEETATVEDFLAAFPEVETPFRYADTVLTQKQDDSLRINYKIFTQFVPDTLFTGTFGKGVKPKFYPYAKMYNNNKLQYLLANAMDAKKKASYLLVFDKKNKFIAGTPLLVLDALANTEQQVSFDRNARSIFKGITRKNADESVSQGQTAYAFDEATASFALVMTQPLDNKAPDLINPIDTFSRKQKYTADYGTGKNNLVSIRDGRRDNKITFFIHIDKENGECTGELKGEATLKSATVAEYRVGGDPCVLEFKFTNNSVTLTEVEGCGAKRDLRCSFNGVYSRKKTPAPKKGAGKK